MLDKLYQVIYSNNLTTKSYKEFLESYKDEEYKRKVYDEVSKRQLYVGNYSDFSNKYQQATQPETQTLTDRLQNVDMSSLTDLERKTAEESIGVFDSDGYAKKRAELEALTEEETFFDDKIEVTQEPDYTNPGLTRSVTKVSPQHTHLFEEAKRQLGPEASQQQIKDMVKKLYIMEGLSQYTDIKVEEPLEDLEDQIGFFDKLGEIFTPKQLSYNLEIMELYASDDPKDKERYNEYIKLYQEGKFDEADDLIKAETLSEKKYRESRERVQAVYTKMLEELEPEKTKLVAKLEMTEKFLTETQQTLQDMYSKSEVSGLSEEEAGRYRTLYSQYETSLASMDNTLARLSSTFEDIQNLQQLGDLTKRTYSNLDVTVNRFKSAYYRLRGGLNDIATEVNPLTIALKNRYGFDVTKENLTSPETKDEFGVTEYDRLPLWAKIAADGIEKSDIRADKFYGEAEKINEYTEKRQQLKDINWDLENFGEFVLDLFSEQALNTALTASTGGYGLGVIAASASGNKFRELREDIIEGENISAAQYYSAGFIYGAAEYITERVALGQFLMGKNALKRFMNLDDSFDIFSNARMTLPKAGFKYGVNVNKEGGAEFVAQLMQNATDKYILDKNISLTEGLNEAYISGGLMSGLGFQAPVLASDIYQAFTYSKEQLQANENSNTIRLNDKKIRALEYKQNYRAKNNLPLLDSTKKAIEKLEQENEALLTENLVAKKVSEDRINSLSNKDKRTLLQIESKSHLKRSYIDSINENADLNNDQKAKLISKAESEIRNLMIKKEKVLDSAQYSKDKVRRAKRQDDLIIKNNLQDNIENVEADTVEDALNKINDVVDNSNLSQEDKAKLKEQAKNDFKDNYDANGATLGAEYGLPITVQIKTNSTDGFGNATVHSHEFGHATLFRKLKESGVDIINMVDMLEKHIKNNYKSSYKIFEVVKRNYKGKTAETIAEEKFMALSDFVRKTRMDADPTLQTKLLKKFKSIFKSEYKKPGLSNEVKTGQDVFNLLTSFNTYFETGEVSSLLKSAFEGKLDIKKTDKKTKTEGTQLSKRVDADVNNLLIETIKSPQTSQNDKASAVKSLIKNNPIIYKALGYSVGKGDISQDDIDSAIKAELLGAAGGQGVINTYDPTASKFSTYLQNIFSRRREQVYKAAGLDEAKLVTGSLESPQARQVADASDVTGEFDNDNNVDDSANDVKINPLKFDKVSPKLDNLNKIVKFEDAADVATQDFATISDKFTGPVAQEIFEVPADKITDPKKNLKYSKKIVDGVQVQSEASKIQEFFRVGQNAIDFIKALPLENVSSIEASNNIGEIIKVSRDVYGRSIGLNNRLLNYFYEKIPGKRSSGLTSQTQMWQLKDEFINPTKETVDKFKADLGITPAGQINLYDRNIGQLLKGSAKLVAHNVSNTLSRIKINELDFKTAKPKKQIIADVKSGVAETLFSQRNYIDKTKKLIEDYGLIPLEASKPNDRAQMETWGSTILPQYLPPFVINSETFGNSSNSATNISKNMFFSGGTGGTRGKVIRAAERNIATKEITPRKYTAEQLKQIKLAIQAKNASYNKNLTSSEYTKFLKDVAAGRKLIIQAFSDMVNDDVNNLRFIAGITYSSSQATNHMVRALAAAVGIEQGVQITNAGRVVKGKGVSEHAFQSGGFGNSLVIALENQRKNPKKPIIKNYIKWLNDGNYYQIALSEKTNGKLKGKDYDFDVMMPKEFAEEFEKALETGDFSKVPSVDIRYFHPKVNANNGGINPFTLIVNGKPISEKHGIILPKGTKITGDLISAAQDLIFKRITNQDTTEAQAIFNDKIKTSEQTLFSVKENAKRFPFLTENMSLKEQKRILRLYDEALKRANDPDAVEKGISVFDFDETLATSNSKVIVKLPAQIVGGKQYGYETWDDGKVKMTSDSEIKISAAEFARDAVGFESIGATFDFSEFTKVVDGKKGPMFDLAMKRQGKFTSKDIFVLTARPQDSARAIHAFLKGMGLNIPIENIVGLEDGRPEAKSNWMISKAAEGYNNFYFADDAYKNVKAVQDVLAVIDVKSDVQQAKTLFSKNLDKEFNKILSENKGIDPNATFSEAAAKTRGALNDKFWSRLFVPPSAEDFKGLMYFFVGKGKKGEAQMKFFEDKLFKPFAKATRDINAAKQKVVDEYSQLTKDYKGVKSKLLKSAGYNNFTFDQAIRVYLMSKNGIEIPGISKRDTNALIKIVESDSDMVAFADRVSAITNMKEGYVIPEDVSWLGSTIEADLSSINTTAKRADYLAEWIKNKEEIFTPDNLNKIEAIYGTSVRIALEDSLYRMEIGSNRPGRGTKVDNEIMDWINGSVGNIMFLNIKTAVLQTLSFANYINWHDNNPFQFAKAVANFPRFAKDFAFIWNSDFLKNRRRGLQQDVSASEIVSQAVNSKNKVKAIIGYILSKGYLPTQMGDSFAIALGGAGLYRNRVGTYLKEGLSQKEAENKAFVDLQELSEDAQQSARPDKISQQQASIAGRVILNFQNTPMQYTRIMKKAALDLANKRGDAKQNISKIIYYGALQNMVFSALQNALFALAFDDIEEDKEKEKYARIANNMADTILRGTGIYGAVISTLKNIALEFVDQNKKGYRADHAYTLIEAVNLSPSIGSKARKIYASTQAIKFNSDEIMTKGFHIDNPMYEVIANGIAAGTNAPLDRALRITQNAREAINKENQAWQRIALVLGWNTWDLGMTTQAQRERERKRQVIKNNKKKKKKSNILW